MSTARTRPPPPLSRNVLDLIVQVVVMHLPCTCTVSMRGEGYVARTFISGCTGWISEFVVAKASGGGLENERKLDERRRWRGHSLHSTES